MMNFGTLKKYMIVACFKGQSRSPETAMGHQQSLACQALVVLLYDTVCIPFVWFLNKCLCLCMKRLQLHELLYRLAQKSLDSTRSALNSVRDVEWEDDFEMRWM